MNKLFTLFASLAVFALVAVVTTPEAQPLAAETTIEQAHEQSSAAEGMAFLFAAPLAFGMALPLFRDRNLSVTKALPAAAAANNMDAIDLGVNEPGQALGDIDCLLEVPALPALVADKTVTFVFQDSADNTTFAAIPELSNLVITGGVGNGAAAVTRRLRLPRSVRRYIRVTQTVLTAGGDNTAVSPKLSLAF